MNIHYSVGNNVPPWDSLLVPAGGMIVYYLVLFAFLYRILTRSDLDTINRILWLLVVVLVPLLGFALYLLTAPKPAAVRRRVTAGSDVAGTPWADDPSFTKGS